LDAGYGAGDWICIRPAIFLGQAVIRLTEVPNYDEFGSGAGRQMPIAGDPVGFFRLVQPDNYNGASVFNGAGRNWISSPTAFLLTTAARKLTGRQRLIERNHSDQRGRRRAYLEGLRVRRRLSTCWRAPMSAMHSCAHAVDQVDDGEHRRSTDRPFSLGARLRSILRTGWFLLHRESLPCG